MNKANTPQPRHAHPHPENLNFPLSPYFCQSLWPTRIAHKLQVFLDLHGLLAE